MTIKKQEFYEGAALHLLARGRGTLTLRHEPPCFVADDRLVLYLKYCTKVRSPWGFTLGAGELDHLGEYDSRFDVVLGFICGGDGVAAVRYDEVRQITAGQTDVFHIACYRKHHEHYEVSGPSGTLSHKVAPSDWSRVLDKGGAR